MPHEETDENTAIASQISDFESAIQVPSTYKKLFDQWEKDRAYVARVQDTRVVGDDTATNHILTTQRQAVADIYPRNPHASVYAAPFIPAAEDPREQEAQQQPQLSAFPPGHENYLRAHEILLNKQIKKAGMKEVLKGGIQDALTLPRTWFKLRWIEDTARDSLGRTWTDPGAQQIARYRVLHASFKDNNFTEQDSNYAEMLELSEIFVAEQVQAINLDLQLRPPDEEETIQGVKVERMDERLDLLNTLTKSTLIDPDDLNVMPHYQGYAFEAIDPEDIRHPWDITRPEDIMASDWMAHRAFMYASEIAELMALVDPEDVKEFLPGEATSDKRNEEDLNNINEEVDSSVRGPKHAVWERYDRRTQRVHLWVEGASKFLDTYTITDGPARFFPFFALSFSRATGELFSTSPSMLLKPAQEEMNGLRTHDRSARKSSYPRWMVSKGLLDKQAKKLMRTAAPYTVIEANKASELKDGIFPLTPATYDPRLFDGSRARQDYEILSGQSTSGLGAVQSGASATAEAIANQKQGVRSNTRKDAVTDLMHDVYEAMMQINAQRMDERTVKAVVGPGAIWLAEGLEREQVLDNTLIGVRSSPNGEAERAQARQELMEDAQFMTQLQMPINRITLLQDWHELKETKHSFSRYLDLNQLLAPPVPAGGSSANGGAPAQQGAEGSNGGRPSNEQRSDDTTAPETIPNRPQIEVS